MSMQEMRIPARNLRPTAPPRIGGIKGSARCHRIEQQRTRGFRQREIAVEIDDEIRGVGHKGVECASGTGAQNRSVATTVAVRLLSVDTLGCADPLGHSVKYPSGPGGTVVTFSKYACACVGRQPPLMLRVALAAIRPPPPATRVSRTRQGCAG